MKREEVLARIDREIVSLKKRIGSRTSPLWSHYSTWSWKDDLEFYEHIKSIIIGSENKQEEDDEKEKDRG